MSRRLILFTSLPEIGGHSTLTYGLCRMLRPHFSEIEVWCRPMPGHGHSKAAAARLEAMGCRVLMLADAQGARHVGAMVAAVWQARRAGRPDVFFSLAMRHFSVVFALLLGAKNSIYYHITHDLNTGTVRRLRWYARVFRRMVFICPATYEEFPGAEDDERFSWIPQSSEIPVQDPEGLLADRETRLEARPPIRFGLLGRLTTEKGSAAMVKFVEQCRVPAELHVAGSGSFADAFRELAKREEATVRVVFHGAYDPTEREEFLRDFFAGIDHLMVPSQDAWETLSMATLESLQHGVPATLCRTGGLKSFHHAELGPAPDEVVRLVEPSDLEATLTRLAERPRRDQGESFTACRNYYETYFSDRQVEQRWVKVTG